MFEIAGGIILAVIGLMLLPLVIVFLIYLVKGFFIVMAIPMYMLVVGYLPMVWFSTGDPIAITAGVVWILLLFVVPCFAAYINHLKDKKNTIKDLDKAIEANPKDAYAYYNRGLAKNKFGQYAEAIKDFDKVIELDPKLAYAYYNRGLAKNKLSQRSLIKVLTFQTKSGNADLATAMEINPSLSQCLK